MQQPLLVLGAVAAALGALGGLGALISALSGRKTTDRTVLVTEYREIFDAQRKHIDDLDEQITSIEKRHEKRIADLEARVDRCEEEKAELRAERVELLAELRKLTP